MPLERCPNCAAFINRIGGCPNCGMVSMTPIKPQTFGETVLAVQAELIKNMPKYLNIWDKSPNNPKNQIKPQVLEYEGCYTEVGVKSLSLKNK